MDIRQLHYFLVLCEEMNYTRAAQRLFLSRQALRQCITALEAELCGPLFVSAHHKLSLTERFSTNKSLLPGCFDRNILATLDLISTFFKHL